MRFRRLPRFAGFAALLACTGCTVLAFQTSRPTFPTDVKIQTACAEYPHTAGDVSAGMAAAAADGWRVMTLGTRTTSFLIFFTEYVVVCYEKRIDSPTGQAAVLPLPAPPSAAVPAPDYGGHSAGGASGAKSLPAPPPPPAPAPGYWGH